MTNGISPVPEMSNDARVRVFRCSFTPPEKQDWLMVDAYVVVTNRYVVICDTMLCPEDMELVIDEVNPALAERKLLIVNSHADWDHVWGNSYFSDEWNACFLRRPGKHWLISKGAIQPFRMSSWHRRRWPLIRR